MLRELRIENLGVVVDAQIEFKGKFTVLTGETGAGKTMVLQALAMVLGSRIDPTLIRNGSVKAIADSVWNVSGIEFDHDLSETVNSEDDEILISRSMTSDGKSKAYLGGRPTTASVLDSLADSLVVVHGQHEQRRLSNATWQREALDRFCGQMCTDLSIEVNKQYLKVRDLRSELKELRSAIDRKDTEVAKLGEELRVFDNLNPVANEDDILLAKIRKIENFSSIQSALTDALNFLSSDEDDRSASDLLNQAIRSLDSVKSDLIVSMNDQLQISSNLINEVVSELTRALADLNLGEESLDDLFSRRAEIQSMIRRYGLPLSEIIEVINEKRISLDNLQNSDVTLEQKELDLKQALEILGKLANKLRTLRESGSKKLSIAVTDELKGLAMTGSEFVVEVADLQSGDLVEIGEMLIGPFGAEEVRFLLRSGANVPSRPISKSASGGELSRIMLALQVVLAGTDKVQTFVFDEVDAGVGGAAAVEVGRRLAALSRTHQVIVVTHLAQVACFADQQIVVSGSIANGVKESDVSEVFGDDRIKEIARMLSGLGESGSAASHAKELLALGATG
jgi:DNA repair protein RecN (Recombination protein N)